MAPLVPAGTAFLFGVAVPLRPQPITEARRGWSEYHRQPLPPDSTHGSLNTCFSSAVDPCWGRGWQLGPEAPSVVSFEQASKMLRSMPRERWADVPVES